MGEMLVNVSIILQDEGTATRDLSRHTSIGGLLPQEPHSSWMKRNICGHM